MEVLFFIFIAIVLIAWIEPGFFKFNIEFKNDTEVSKRFDDVYDLYESIKLIFDFKEFIVNGENISENLLIYKKKRCHLGQEAEDYIISVYTKNNTRVFEYSSGGFLSDENGVCKSFNYMSDDLLYKIEIDLSKYADILHERQPRIINAKENANKIAKELLD